MELALEYKNRGLYEGQGLQGVNVWIDLLLSNLRQTFVFGFHANFRERSSMGKG